ncbi:MAG: hypothetical protein QXG39_02570 [Candidatus Aenigmatarchaeota archaeon]
MDNLNLNGKNITNVDFICFKNGCKNAWEQQTSGSSYNATYDYHVQNDNDLSPTNEIQNVIPNQGLIMLNNNFGLMTCSNGQILKSTGSSWQCSIDNTGITMESDPIWSTEKTNYYTKTESDSRYQQGSELFNTTDEIEMAVNTTKFYQIKISCDNIIQNGGTDTDFCNDAAGSENSVFIPPYGNSTHAWHFDDFLSGAVSGRYITFGTQSVNTADPDVWGVYNYATGAVSGDDAGFSLGGSTTTTLAIFNVTKIVIFETRIKLVSTTGQRTFIGAIRTSTSQNLNTANNGVFFNYTTGSNWIATTCNAGTCTRTNTGVAADTNYNVFRITINTTHALFHINNNLVASHTTNIPIANLVAWLGVWTETTDTDVDNIRVDYVYFVGKR